jgi:hypothetical protein
LEGGHWGLSSGLAKQKFYCLNHTSKVFHWAEPQTVDPPPSGSQVARITSMTHGCLAPLHLQKPTCTKDESLWSSPPFIYALHLKWSSTIDSNVWAEYQGYFLYCYSP